MVFKKENGALVCYNNGEILRIESWGKDSLRVRSTMLGQFTGNDWALTEVPAKTDACVEVKSVKHWVGDGTLDKREIATIVNGRIKAVVNFVGIISFHHFTTF